MEHTFLSLSFLVLIPLIPMFLILSPFFPRSAIIVRRFTKWFAGVHFLYSYLFILFFDQNLISLSYKNEFSIFNMSWIKTLGIKADFALDGLSIIFCILTTFIFFIALIVSKYAIKTKHKLYYSMMLLLETSILGVFCSNDMFLLFMFLSLSIIPLYFLILNWGGSQKEADKFFIFNIIGNMFILFGILILYSYSFSASGVLSGSIESIDFDEISNPIWLQILTFMCFIIGFGTKFPIFSLHSFITKIQENSPMPVNIILSSVFYNIGLYGIIRFNMLIFPTTFKTMALIFMILSIVGIIHCSINAFIQNNIKRIIFYLSVVFVNFIMIGLTTFTIEGIKGSIFMAIAVSLIFSMLYLISGIIYLRTNTFDINELGGLARKSEKLMYFSIFICLAVTGLPFLIMFPPELMIITGTFTTKLLDEIPFFIGGIVTIFSLILVAFSVMRFLHGIFFGNMLTKFSNVKDISMSEFISLLGITIPILILGIVPSVLINIYESFIWLTMNILRI